MTSQNLLNRAVGTRHGILDPPVVIPTTRADPPDVYHASISREDKPQASAGGGVARTVALAETCATGEALERYVAMTSTLPVCFSADAADDQTVWPMLDWSLHSEEQRSRPDFPHNDAYPEHYWLSECFSMVDNSSVWVPAALVPLRSEHGALATSSGLAAHTNAHLALLRATQELIERDAFMSTWVHQLGGRLVNEGPADPVLGGECEIYDLTPAYSPHPVAAAMGWLDLEGQRRFSIGLACRSTWAEAAEKATLELLQGTVFVGHHLRLFPDLVGLASSDVRDFDAHAIYYAANPAQWPEIPLRKYRSPSPVPVGDPRESASDELDALIAHVSACGVRLAYRDLTTVDVNTLGLRVVRVVSPELTPLHHDHRWPFLGGRASDIDLRYRDGDSRHSRTYPSPFPHALG